MGLLANVRWVQAFVKDSYKLSPMTTQANGPQVMAKDAMNMQAATIMTMPELSYSAGGRAIATAAKIRSHIDCHRPPVINGIRRPSLSMRYKPGKVVTTLTAPRMSWTKRGSSIPADVKMVAPYCVTSQQAAMEAEKPENLRRRSS
jgi:hypothetical protein